MQNSLGTSRFTILWTFIFQLIKVSNSMFLSWNIKMFFSHELQIHFTLSSRQNSKKAWKFNFTVFILTVKHCNDPKIPTYFRKYLLSEVFSLYLWHFRKLIEFKNSKYFDRLPPIWCVTVKVSFLMWLQALYMIYNLCTFMLFCMSFSVLANTHKLYNHFPFVAINGTTKAHTGAARWYYLNDSPTETVQFWRRLSELYQCAGAVQHVSNFWTTHSLGPKKLKTKKCFVINSSHILPSLSYPTENMLWHQKVNKLIMPFVVIIL